MDVGADKLQSGVILCVGSVDEFCSAVYSLQYEMQPGHAVRMLRGRNMLSARALFSECAAALQFPCYFGYNWNAFDECIADLEWLPAAGYLIMIVDGKHVLENEQGEVPTFFRIMRSVAREWSDGSGLPFQTVLQCGDEEVEIFRRLSESPLDVVRVSDLKALVHASQYTPREG